ncbi:GntR family transcriptional regulator [Aeoliella sp.]|uniref:GntR family transcriptional regulator n=1 Tax=Aeoliella sp. TaxID=2795800 RepID=UPI003CCC1C74
MARSGSDTPRLVELAEKLASDIEDRNLKPGDRYLTTVDASKLLGVSNGLANRALQLLERRQIITRQQRRGAFIANLPGELSVPPLRRVHFLVHQNYLASEGVGNDMVLLGMQEELPGVHVQISFLPQENADGFVADLIDHSLTAKARDGFILVRAPFEVHQLVSNSGVPALVYGGIYPGITRLTRLDRDMTSIGYLATDYLLSQGHRKLALLSRQETRPGDHDTFDAVRRRLTEAKLDPDALYERFLPPATSVCEASVQRLLIQDDPPTGFICRTVRMANAVREVAKKLKMSKKIDRVLCDSYSPANQAPEHVFLRPLYSSEEQGKHIARMLAAMARGEVVADEVIPVELDASAK